MSSGVYTTARLCRWRVYELDHQIARLVSSYSKLFSPSTLKRAELAKQWRDAIQEEKIRRSGLGDLKCGVRVEANGKISIDFNEFPKKNSNEPIHVVFGGAPRKNASIKNLRWIEERKSFVDPKAEETLLVDESGAVLEGSQTNFFVVKKGILYTAQENILLGTVRAAALDVCKALNIPVVLSPPNTRDLNVWDEAFLASTSRLVMSIDVIDDKEMPTSRPITRSIQKWVEKTVEERSLEIDEEALKRYAAMDENDTKSKL